MNKNIYRALYKLIMACSSTRDSETTSTASGSHPRRFFPLETVIIWINMTVLQIYGYLQRESSSRDSSPVDNEGSPDVDEAYRLRCDCKSTCQRRGCPCLLSLVHLLSSSISEMYRSIYKFACSHFPNLHCVF